MSITKAELISRSGHMSLISSHDERDLVVIEQLFTAWSLTPRLGENLKENLGHANNEIHCRNEI